MITSNIRNVRKRLHGLQRRLPDVGRNAINRTGDGRRFALVAQRTLRGLATEETMGLVDLFVETVLLAPLAKGLRVTMKTPNEAFEVRAAQLEQLGGRKRAADVPEQLQRMREAVRQWVLTEKRLDPAEAANPDLAVARIWHLLGIHPDSTATSRDRQFTVAPDGSIILNPWGRVVVADLDAGARALLASDSPTGLPAALQRAGLGGLDPVLAQQWLAAVLAAWVAEVRSLLGGLFKAELRRVWKQLGGTT